jgi:hypothetical protein
MTVRKYSTISLETTLASSINSSVTSATVATGTGTTLLGGVTLTAGDIFLCAIDPDTSSEEIVYVTARSGDTLTITRGQAGTTAISHANGATIQHVFTGEDAQHFEDGVNSAITATSTSTLSNKTLTAPKFANGGFIADANGNEEIKFVATTSAVNEITITNAATGNDPSIAATGDDTNIDLNLVSKGTGVVQANTIPIGLARLGLNAQSGTTYTLVASDLNKIITTSNASAVTITVPSGVFSAGDQIHIAQLGDGQVTIADNGTSVVNAANGKKLAQKFSVATVICTASNTFLVIGDTSS